MSMDAGEIDPDLVRRALGGIAPLRTPTRHVAPSPLEPVPAPAAEPAEVEADTTVNANTTVNAEDATAAPAPAPEPEPESKAADGGAVSADDPEKVHAIFENVVTAVEQLTGREVDWDGSVTTMDHPDAPDQAFGSRTIRVHERDLRLLEDVVRSNGPLPDNGSGDDSAPARLSRLVSRVAGQAAYLTVPRGDQSANGPAAVIQEGAAHVWAAGHRDPLLDQSGLRAKLPDSYSPDRAGYDPLDLSDSPSNVRDAAYGAVQAIAGGASLELPTTAQDRASVAQELLATPPADVWRRSVELLEPYVVGADELPDRTKTELAAKLETRMSALIETAGPLHPSVESWMADAAYDRVEATEYEMKTAVRQQSPASQAFSPRSHATNVATDVSSTPSFGEATHTGARGSSRPSGPQNAR